MRKTAINPLLQDQGISPLTDHNIGARILRLGLSVTAFSMLESRLQVLFSKFMSDISNSAIPYRDHSDAFKTFVTVNAISGLKNEIDLKRGSIEKIRFAEKNITKFSASVLHPAMYNGFGFSPKGSNVGADDVRDAFKAIGVQHPWRKLTEITKDMGSARADLESDFKNLAVARHRSAHNPNANIASTDLLTNIDVAGLVATAVGALLQTLMPIFKTATDISSLQSQCIAPTVIFRFLDLTPRGMWAEKSLAGKVMVRHAKLDDAVRVACARRGNRAVVSRSASLVPLSLHSY